MADAEPVAHTLTWTKVRAARRGPGPDVSRIVRAAIDLADAEGIEAVSMRRVAAAIGAGTMSLYRYVPKKEDLFDLMIDAVGGEYDLPAEPSGDPRADLTGLAASHPREALTLQLALVLGRQAHRRPTHEA